MRALTLVMEMLRIPKDKEVVLVDAYLEDCGVLRAVVDEAEAVYLSPTIGPLPKQPTPNVAPMPLAPPTEDMVRALLEYAAELMVDAKTVADMSYEDTTATQLADAMWEAARTCWSRK